MSLAQLDTHYLKENSLTYSEIILPDTEEPHLPDITTVSIRQFRVQDQNWILLYPSQHLILLEKLAALFDKSEPDIGLTDVSPLIPEFNPDSRTNLLIDQALLSSHKLVFGASQPGILICLEPAQLLSLNDNARVERVSLSLEQIDEISGSDLSPVPNHVQSIRRKRILPPEIPPLNSTCQKLIALRNQPDARGEDLAAIVELDPGLAGQVVGWASSPYYSAPGSVRSVKDAVVRVLGFDLVLNMATGLTLGSPFTSDSLSKSESSAFWRQSICAAILMERLNQALPPKFQVSAGTAYLVGLLNNIGQLFLSFLFPSQNQMLIKHQPWNTSVPPRFVERALLGITRDEIAAHICSAWKLPKSVIIGLREQNNAEYSDTDFVFANLCYLTTRLLAQEGVGHLPVERIEPEVVDRLMLDQEAIKNKAQQLTEQPDEIERLLRLMA